MILKEEIYIRFLSELTVRINIIIIFKLIFNPSFPLSFLLSFPLAAIGCSIHRWLYPVPLNDRDPFNFDMGLDKGYKWIKHFNIFINSYLYLVRSFS